LTRKIGAQRAAGQLRGRTRRRVRSCRPGPNISEMLKPEEEEELIGEDNTASSSQADENAENTSSSGQTEQQVYLTISCNS
jgi:hypothetical protein